VRISGSRRETILIGPGGQGQAPKPDTGVRPYIPPP
jgi:hypothetical protein